MVRRLQGHARPAARAREADDRADQRDRGRRRERAADGVRPRGDRGRRLHPSRRARARLRPGGRRDAVAPADGRRPPGPRDRLALRRDPGAAGRGVGPRQPGGARRPSSTRVVDGWVESLARKLPQTTRYAKQQLNVWRDMAWHQTVGHARDWLSLSMLGDEAQDAITAFLESRRGPRPRTGRRSAHRGRRGPHATRRRRPDDHLQPTRGLQRVQPRAPRSAPRGADRGGRSASDARRRDHGRRQGLLRGPGPEGVRRGLGLDRRRARADLPPERPARPRRSRSR